MSLEQQRLEFLMDTVNYYSEDVNRRAVDLDGNYVYYDKTTQNKCAIGRFIEPGKLNEKKFKYYSVNDDEIFNLLPKNIQDLGKNFLNSVQCLHDSDLFWSKEGLTELGKKELDKIKHRYSLL